MVIGGWGEGTMREQIVAQAIDFLKKFEGKDWLLAPHSPRPFGCIVKAQCMDHRLTVTAS